MADESFLYIASPHFLKDRRVDRWCVIYSFLTAKQLELYLAASSFEHGIVVSDNLRNHLNPTRKKTTLLNGF